MLNWSTTIVTAANCCGRGCYVPCSRCAVLADCGSRRLVAPAGMPSPSHAATLCWTVPASAAAALCSNRDSREQHLSLCYSSTLRTHRQHHKHHSHCPVATAATHQQVSSRWLAARVVGRPQRWHRLCNWHRTKCTVVVPQASPDAGGV